MRNGFQAWFAALAVGLAALAAAAPALADITVDVNQAAVQPLPIALAPFGGDPIGAQISAVVSADLERSGLFRPLDPATFRVQPPDVMQQPASFDPWKSIGAQALLVGQASTGSDGRLSVDVRLWDVYAGEELGIDRSGKTGLRLQATPDSWRTIAHQIADAVYEKLTGEKGYFDTRVVFVAESGPKTHRVTRLAIMDQDGANPSARYGWTAWPSRSAFASGPASGDHLRGAAADRGQHLPEEPWRPAARKVAGQLPGHDHDDGPTLLARRQQGRLSPPRKGGAVKI